MAQTDLSRYPLLWTNLVWSIPIHNRHSGPICVAKRLFLAYFGPFLAPLRSHLGHSGSWTLPKLNCRDVLIGFSTLFHPFQPKIGPLGWSVWPKDNFIQFCLFFAPLGPLLGHSASCKWPKLVCFDVIIGVPTLFHLFQPKIGLLGWFVWPNGYSSLFGPIWAPIGQHLGLSGSGKWAKLLSFKVLSAGQPCSNLLY